MGTSNISEGEQLKASALKKIGQARALLDSALSDLCNLEGPGYCSKYEKAQEYYYQLGDLMHKIRDLKPPTGVFHA